MHSVLKNKSGMEVNGLTLITIGVAIIAPIAYLIFIEDIVYMISPNNSDSSGFNNSSEEIEGLSANVGVGESIEVTVTRNRWYGTIFETITPEGKTAYITWFGYKLIPMEIRGVQVFVFHIAFAMLYLVGIWTYVFFAMNGENANNPKSEAKNSIKMKGGQSEITV